MLHAFEKILRDNKDPIARCLTDEEGKRLMDAVVEVVRSADLVSYAAEEGIRILSVGCMPDCFPGNGRNKVCMASKIPLSVVLAIPPLNYPVSLAVSKISPALVAGNSVVLKPPNSAPNDQYINDSGSCFLLAHDALYACGRFSKRAALCCNGKRLRDWGLAHHAPQSQMHREEILALPSAKEPA